MGEIGSNAATISLEKDWVIILAKELSVPVKDINSKLRRLDLLCKTLAPVAFTAIYSALPDIGGSRIVLSMGLIILWNVLSYPLEVIYMQNVYANFSSLSYKFHIHSDGTKHSHENGDFSHSHSRKENTRNKKKSEKLEEGEYLLSSDSDSDSVASTNSSFKPIETEDEADGSRLPDELGLWAGLKVYFKHSLFSASFASSMLWMTAISNGSLMTGYLHYEKVSPVVFGTAFASGALLGLMGTIIYPVLEKRFGCELSGLFSIATFSFLLLPVGILYLPIFEQTLHTDYILLVIVAFSRPALWSFDLAFTEICQKHVEEEFRGLIGGFQMANNTLWCLIKQVILMFSWFLLSVLPVFLDTGI
eukprot:snap_masked-scaffold_22-processed-gene-3.34-mRNA-1 protein AED:1.00 eAED:1.00 QI:0/0/0/0/1/1/6/0/361